MNGLILFGEMRMVVLQSGSLKNLKISYDIFNSIDNRPGIDRRGYRKMENPSFFCLTFCRNYLWVYYWHASFPNR